MLTVLHSVVAAATQHLGAGNAILQRAETFRLLIARLSSSFARRQAAESESSCAECVLSRSWNRLWRILLRSCRRWTVHLRAPRNRVSTGTFLRCSSDGRPRWIRRRRLHQHLTHNASPGNRRRRISVPIRGTGILFEIVSAVPQIQLQLYILSTPAVVWRLHHKREYYGCTHVQHSLIDLTDSVQLTTWLSTAWNGTRTDQRCGS